MIYSIVCKNCGKYGHILNKCKFPVMSCGVLLFREINNDLEFLMVNRKMSYGFHDFMIGSYSKYNINQIQISINEMSIYEKNIILNNEKWLKHWETTIAKNTLVQPDLQFIQLVYASSTNWNETEWEFPKGRRKNLEWDIDCSVREFEEETGIPRTAINIINNIDFVTETFVGSNGKKYTNKYICAKWNGTQDIGNNFDTNEIQDVKWFNTTDIFKIIRPYNKEKLKMIKDLIFILKGNEHKITNLQNRW